jgi:hypothetical protein
MHRRDYCRGAAGAPASSAIAFEIFGVAEETYAFSWRRGEENRQHANRRRDAHAPGSIGGTSE